METFKDVKARLISVDEVVNLLLQKRSYSKEDDFCWKIYTEMIQDVKNIPETETPRQLKEDLERAVELLKCVRRSINGGLAITQDSNRFAAIKTFLTSIENKKIK